MGMSFGVAEGTWLTLHSPHIGPTGGGMCTDNINYVDTVESTYFNISFIPDGVTNGSLPTFPAP